MTEYDAVKIKDQLGRPENKGITLKRFRDDIIIEEGPLAVITVAISTAFILGSVTKGILGTSFLGEGDRTENILRVVNQDNFYRERFTTTTYEDTTTTTGDWADTEGTLVIASAEIAQSKAIAYGDQTINYAILNITFVNGDTSTLAIQLTADGTSNWATITAGIKHIFDASARGDDLRFKITNSGAIVTINYINIEYN